MAQRKLLLADDSITIQKVINLTFADEGISVTSVGNGLAAIEQLQEVSPDLVLADVHMPGLTGYEVCEQIRKTPGFENIPVMLLVGSFEPFDEAEARRVGADDFLTKPFQSIKQLVSKVHSLLESSNGAIEPELQTAAVSNEQAASAASVSDFSFFDDKTSNDDLLQVNEGNFSFRDVAFDDEMIETSSVNSDFADTFEDLDISTPAASQVDKSDNEWRVVAPETHNRFEGTSAEQHEAPTIELDINEISSPLKTDQWQFETENADDWQIVEAEPAGSEEISHNFSETETVSESQQPAAETSDLDLDFHSESVIDAEPEMNFAGQASREEKLVSPFADLFDDDDLLGIEDEIRAEIGEQNLQQQPAESQAEPDAAITPEIMTPETGNQSQEIATVNQSTAVEKPGEYATLNFPPEVIDAIAARVVEKLSDKVIEKIAWEIVPDRFDLIVRKTIQNKDRER